MSILRSFPAVQRWLAAAAVLLTVAVGPLSAASAEAAGSVSWQAAVGYQSSNMAIQSNFFFPNNITIDAGDSVTWTLKSGEFHTISFLSGGPRPGLIVGGTFNPAVLFPVPVVPPTQWGSATYNGTGYVNSGAMGALPIPKFTVTFPTAGDYEYNCLVHLPMKGWVHVQPAGTPYPHSQAYYTAKARAAEMSSLGQGYALAALGLARALSQGVGHVTAGIGKFFSTGSIAVVSFLPQVAVIHEGQSVTWNNRDPEFPHTITFNFDALDALGNPFAFFGPMGGTTMTSTSQDLNSGFLVAGGPTQFTVKFDAPGVYAYRCVLHDDLGMKGTVVVLPGS